MQYLWNMMNQMYDYTSGSRRSCKKCIVCVYNIFRMSNETYRNVFLCYEYLWNICGRSFSRLKFVKSRLRSFLSNDNLKTLMTMFTEKELVESVHHKYTINKHIDERNSFMKKHLIGQVLQHQICNVSWMFIVILDVAIFLRTLLCLYFNSFMRRYF